MSSPVNPIIVVRDNLPEFKAELLAEREKLVVRVNVIDEQLTTIERLREALGIETMAVTDGDVLPSFDPQVHG